MPNVLQQRESLRIGYDDLLAIFGAAVQIAGGGASRQPAPLSLGAISAPDVFA